MNTAFLKRKERNTPRYLTALGAWALAFGCIVGWGSFSMPGSTFLPLAGPVGTALGLGLGALAMLLIGANYHWLMNADPDMGGTYAYCRDGFGYDYGLLAAWFLGLTYLAILWANASALPLVVNTLFGGALRFGFSYTVAGSEVYLGEILLALLSLCLAAALCLRRELSMRVQIVMALVLIVGVLVCFFAALLKGSAAQPFQPAYAPGFGPGAGIMLVFALAPWAYVGFETVSHSAEEARFPLKKSFAVMAAALAAGGVVYILLSLLAVTSLPAGCASWTEYAAKLDSFSGAASQPTFFAAQTALGGAGSVLLGLAAFCAILSCLIACFTALSRLLQSLSDDRLLPDWVGRPDQNHVPRNAILLLLGVSAIFPFFGRTAAGWIVDVGTVGAAIAYATVSAAAWKAAKAEKKGRFVATGVLGVAVSVLFVLEFMLPSINIGKTMSTQSYLILAVWAVLGFFALRYLLAGDRENRLGRSVFLLVVLLGITVFSSSVWFLRAADTAVEQAMAGGANSLQGVDATLTRNIVIQASMIVIALSLMMDTYSFTHRRERQNEIEKAVAEDAGRAKASFLSNMSHEIRTPMNAIIGLDSIALRNPNLEPQTREQLEKIGDSAKQLLVLINDTLDMGLIESGKMQLREEEFSLQQFLDQVNAKLNAQCAAKGLYYECSIVGRLRDYYYGDAAKLKRLLLNILDNAVKFTGAPGRVLLVVEHLEEGEGEGSLRFTVRDTGIGIDEDYLPRLFEPFSQEDSSTTSRYGGSGLGLAIAKSFVDMMQGSIEVESKKGVGTVFTVTIPLKRSERSIQLEKGILTDEVLRAAVVDSDPIASEHARMVLKDIGIEADCYLDPWEAIERIREAYQLSGAYGLVITDYKLPNMNGLELTRMIREFDGGKTAVIMLTGYNWDIVEDEALEDGVDSIGAKPLFADSLLREIQSVLARKEGRELPEENEQEEPIERILSGRRILMAEDIELNAEILRDILELQGMTAEHAENGEIAVEMFTSKPAGYYDAILMDVRMPVMDGLSATKAIRALEREDAQSIPIIAMTANVFDEDVQHSMEAGMNAHLPKPVDPELLYTTLARQIAAREAET